MMNETAGALAIMVMAQNVEVNVFVITMNSRKGGWKSVLLKNGIEEVLIIYISI